MIRFIDLNTGNAYDGGLPYVHWFDKEQSTNIIYNLKLCFYSDRDKIEVSLPESEIFKIVDPSKLGVQDIEINGFKYKDIKQLTTRSLNMEGVYYKGVYIYMLYLLSSSSSEGEFIETLNIGDEQFYIGSDFYQENESLYINLSNNGTDIPESVQKAIYYSDIHEDYKDNILINRKWKELLSNYIDIVNNRGSYDSLINSLKWFEWGDGLRVREVWRHDERFGTLYDDRDIKSIIEGKFADYLSGFAKTTYISLQVPLYDSTGEYDSEMNPVLRPIIFKWSKEELALKLSLLGSFFETYFMPIHLELIHSTIEADIFTNTIKILGGGIKERTDQWLDNSTVKCNIVSGDRFVMGDVSCQVNNNTFFGTEYKEGDTDYDNIDIIGVDSIIDTIKDEDEMKTFYLQDYNGVGVVINFKMLVPVDRNDFIKSNKITIYNQDSSHVTRADYRVFYSTHKSIGGDVFRYQIENKDKYIEYDGTVFVNKEEILPDYVKEERYYSLVEFNILRTREGRYKIIYESQTSFNTFIKTIDINVVDDNYLNFKVMRAIKKTDPLEEYMNWGDITEYILTRSPKKCSTYTQYVPTSDKYGKSYLNNVLIIEGDVSEYEYIDDNYFTLIKDSFKYVRRPYFKLFPKTLKFNYGGGDENLSVSSNQYWKLITESPIQFIPDTINFKYGVLEDRLSIKLNRDIEWKINQVVNTPIEVPSQPVDDSQTTVDSSIFSIIPKTLLFDYIGGDDIIRISTGRYTEWIIDKENDYIKVPVKYTICVSKRFGYIPDLEKLKDYTICRNDYGFFPQFYNTVELIGDTLKDYTIIDTDILVMKVDTKYSQAIDIKEWVFTNVSDNKTIAIDSSRGPFILNDIDESLSKGYYNISLYYKNSYSTNNILSKHLSSAFFKETYL